MTDVFVVHLIITVCDYFRWSSNISPTMPCLWCVVGVQMMVQFHTSDLNKAFVVLSWTWALLWSSTFGSKLLSLPKRWSGLDPSTSCPFCQSWFSCGLSWCRIWHFSRIWNLVVTHGKDCYKNSACFYRKCACFCSIFSSLKPSAIFWKS